jgi:dTDP-4-dehydrorhamnose reductase
MRVVDDQISGPTSARLLAELSALLLAKTDRSGYDWLKENSGIYHAAGDGACSRYSWAEKILELDPQKEEQVVKKLDRASSSEFSVLAQRPMVSILKNDKITDTFGLRLPSWQTGLSLTMQNA